MNRVEVENMIRQSNSFNDFINNQDGKMKIQIGNVPIWIWKEGIGGTMYYELPYHASYDYSVVCDFMKYAIPFLSELIEKKRSKNLSKSDF